MNGFWPVLKVTFRDNFGLSVLRDRYLRRRQRLWEPILILFAIVMGVGSLETGLVFVAKGIVSAAAPLGQAGLVFVMAFLAVQVLTLVMGISMVISIFYFSEDLTHLVPLPVGAGAIVASKFLVILAGEYVTALIIIAPAVIAYTPLAAANPWYWVGLVLAFLLAPVLPLALASIAGLFLMRLINRRHRDILMVVTSIVLVILIMSVQFLFTNTVAKQDPAYVMRLLSEKMGLMKAVGGYFPPSLWAGETVALAGTVAGGKAFLLLAGVSILSLMVVAVVGERLFFKGLIGGQEVAAKRRSVGARELAVQARSGSVVAALFWREWKLFMRVPIFVMNGFMASVIVPVVAVFPIMSEAGGLGQALALLRGSPLAAEITVLAAAGIIAFLGSLNTTGSTSLSREGKNFWISKVIPVRPVQQVQAKLLFSLVAAVISAAPVVLAYAVAARASLFNILVVTVLGTLASLVGLIIGLVFDMTRPYFKWTNPQQAVKNNLNAVFPMFVDAVVLGGLAFLSVKMVQAALAPVVVYALLGAILFALDSVAYRITISQAEMRYNRLDA